MAQVCRDFRIPRKTSYKIFDRYKEHGFEALFDRSRRRLSFAHQLPPRLYGRVSPAQIAERARQSSSASAGVTG